MITCLCFSNCNKNKNKSNIILYNKSITTIQSYIHGKWELIYGKGGVATTTQYYHNNFWEFNNARVKILDNVNIVADTTIYWNYDLGSFTNGDSTFLMKFYHKENVPWVYVVYIIYNDTLILHDNSSDYIFTILRNQINQF